MSVVACDTDIVLSPGQPIRSAGDQIFALTVPEERSPVISELENPRVEVRCFGRFELWVDGTLVPLDSLRPQQLSLLRLLSINSGSALHEESLMEHFWPDKGLRSAKHSLHVAVSAVRRVLDSLPEPQRCARLSRRGDGYFLDLPQGSWVDIATFERIVKRLSFANGSGAVDVVELREALRIYRGDLLVEEGPSTWVVTERMRLQVQAARLATALAEAELWRKELSACIDTCLRGLAIDRYHDPLWRLLIMAYDRAGDMASSYRARRDYARVLAELGAVVTGLTDHLGSQRKTTR